MADAILSWFEGVLLVPSAMQTIVVVSLAGAIGLLLGRIQIAKISLGVTFVFFVGLLMAHLGIQTDAALIGIIQSFGLVLFIYALGVEVGPSFFPSLRSKGIGYNLEGLSMIVITYVVVVALHYISGESMSTMLGLMSGAVTNTPVLAAVQSTLQASGLPDATAQGAEAAMATAVAYPLGIVGVILGIAVLHRFAPKRSLQEVGGSRAAFAAEFEVTNPHIFGRNVRDVAAMTDKHFVISRLWRGGEVTIPSSSTMLEEGDHLLTLCSQEELDNLITLFGKRSDRQDWNRSDINWDTLDTSLSNKRIIITNPKLNGVKLGSLRLRNKYGINITRIDRVGIELLASPDLYLQTGDRLTIVGESGALDKVEELLGNSIAMLEKPRLVSFFWGLCLGCLIGIIPLYIPGMNIPIQLGLAGGPIVVGILMGAFGPRLGLATYMTNSATQLIKQIGIILFLAGLGLSNGSGFVETLINGDGLLWLLLGFIITVVPSMIMGAISLFVLRKGFAETAGMVCGTMANPFALDYATDLTASKTCNVAYATVYPVAMFVRIITTQLLLLFFI